MCEITLAGRARLVGLDEPGEARRLEAFVAAHPLGTPFHRPVWLAAVARGTGNRALALVLEQGGELTGYLPLSEIHSPLFGRLLASSGFAVGGGVLLAEGADPEPLFAAVEELALRRSCPSVELRGGVLPEADPAGRDGWVIRRESHCGFARPLTADDEAELLAIPRKQRAEVRRALGFDLAVSVGTGKRDRDAHYAVYAESVRNLGTPVFPRGLFEAVLDGMGDDADILTVWSEGKPLSSVLSLYHANARGRAVMPYWGGGTRDARKLRANDRMYYALMLHARAKGCDRFDFGRSKTGSGAYDFKRNWGFEPEPLAYGVWTASGAEQRDADPNSSAHARQIAIWRKLPLPVANLVGPLIARGLG